MSTAVELKCKDGVHVHRWLVCASVGHRDHLMEHWSSLCCVTTAVYAVQVFVIYR